MIEKQFKAKADQIAKLTQELESMKALVFETSQSGYIRDQLQAIRNIGEVMANPSSSSSYEEYNDNSNDNDYSPHESNGVNGSSRGNIDIKYLYIIPYILKPCVILKNRKCSRQRHKRLKT